MAKNNNGKVAIPAKTIVQRIDGATGPVAGAGVAKKGYGKIETTNKGR